MKLNPAPSFYGKKKAEILGLTSSRFKEKYMSEHAEKEMNTIKRKDRSDIDVTPALFSYQTGKPTVSTKPMRPNSCSNVPRMWLRKTPRA